MDKRTFLKHLRKAREKVAHEQGNHDGSLYARGMASEGYTGGYIQALSDVEAMLTHGHPNDPRGYWGRP